MLDLAEECPDLSISMLSVDGELAEGWHEDSECCLFHLAGRTPLLEGVDNVLFSACNTWVIAFLPDVLRLYRVSDLKAGKTECCKSVACYDAAFAADGSVVGLGADGLFRLSENRDGSISRSTLGEGITNAYRLSVYENILYVEERVMGQDYIYHLFTMDGERLPDENVMPRALNIGVQGYRLCDWNRTPIAIKNWVDQQIFNAAHMQPDVLKEWIKYKQMTVTWDRTGLTLPTVEGSVTVMWPPVAKLLEPAEAHEYRLRCAANPGFFKEFGMTLNDLDGFFDAFNSIHITHQSLWDACEDVHQAKQAHTLTTSKSQALAALRRARSTSDEPALIQELPTALVGSLCRTDRLAFRHHEPDACKHVNSVLDLLCAASDKPSDPWCSEEAVNLALSQCGKPAAHAQRAALRLDTELRDGLLVIPFRKLALHAQLEGFEPHCSHFVDCIRRDGIERVSPSGEIVTRAGIAYSLRTGALLSCDNLCAFSPCGKWAFAYSYESEKLQVLSVDDLLRGVRKVVFEKAFDEFPDVRFLDRTTIFVNKRSYEVFSLYHGTLQPDGSFTLSEFVSGRCNERPGGLSVFKDSVCYQGAVYDLSGEKICQYKGLPITHEVAVDVSNSYGHSAVLITYDGSKLATVDNFDISLIGLFIGSHFLKPSVLADLIKLVDKRITWSDKGISLPTVDGGTFTFWWDPVRTLLEAGIQSA